MTHESHPPAESRAGRSIVSVRWRLMGLVPLAIFLMHAHRNWSLGNPGHILWMCHVSNLTLACGLLLGQPSLIRLATIWLIPGVPLWIMDLFVTREFPVITFFSHLLCPAIGVFAIRAVGAARWTWLYALGWFLLVQQITRICTPPELNVNVAHTMYVGWERVFGAYWQYWLFVVAGSTATLWCVGRGLLFIAPPKGEASGYAETAS